MHLNSNSNDIAGRTGSQSGLTQQLGFLKKKNNLKNYQMSRVQEESFCVSASLLFSAFSSLTEARYEYLQKNVAYYGNEKRREEKNEVPLITQALCEE